MSTKQMNMWIYMAADKSRPRSLRLSWFRAPVKLLVKILINPVFTWVKGLAGTWSVLESLEQSPISLVDRPDVCALKEGHPRPQWSAVNTREGGLVTGVRPYSCFTLSINYDPIHTHFISTDFWARGKLGITKILLPVIIYQRQSFLAA